jgi:hypothetical protein
MAGFRILRSTDRYIVLVTDAAGTRRWWSPWFASKEQAQAWIDQQSKTLPKAIDS